MPYASPAEYREAHAARYAEIYSSSRKFRANEAVRKADWYAAKASDPAWLAEQAAKKREQRARAKKAAARKAKR